ncbi:MAG: hypothetical protein ACOC59_01700 [Bacteroidota bacterium]
MFIPDNKDGFFKSEMSVSPIQAIYYMTEMAISDNEDGVSITGLRLMVVDHIQSGVGKYLSEPESGLFLQDIAFLRLESL